MDVPLSAGADRDHVADHPGMLDLTARVRLGRTPAVLALTAAAALALPSAAAAKTFVSHLSDPAGDSTSDSLDITSVRVAYNRRTGALSASLTVAGSIDTAKDAVFAVGLSDLVGGKCQTPILLVGGVFTEPSLGVAQLMNTQGVTGKAYIGTGSVADDTFSVRAKNRALAGKTVGCAMAFVTSNAPAGTHATVYDATKGNDGFVG